jgi:hypothetical protein
VKEVVEGQLEAVEDNCCEVKNDKQDEEFEEDLPEGAGLGESGDGVEGASGLPV